jgi:hypothetical protein
MAHVIQLRPRCSSDQAGQTLQSHSIQILIFWKEHCDVGGRGVGDDESAAEQKPV